MATVRDGNTSALIIIDMQNNVIATAHDREGVIARTATLIDRARREKVPVIFVQHEDDEMVVGSDAWQIVPELAPQDGETVVRKRYQDAFEDTALEGTLAEFGATHLVIAGAQTDACVRFSTQRALVEGYDMTLVTDCHTTSDIDWAGVSVKAADIIAHTNLVYQFATYPDRSAGAATHDAIVFATPAGSEETFQDVAD